MPPIKTIWEIDPHTKAKHIILRKYLDAWLPIISHSFKKLNYIDGFSGPGEYLSNEKGSPIIAVESVIEHNLNLNCEINFLFIEKDKKRCNHLKKFLSNLNLPQKPKINIKIECGKFSQTIKPLLDELDKANSRIAPTFLFIDPFGFSDIPIDLIKQFMKHSKCEVLITFMYRDVNRFISNKDNNSHLDELFGCAEWRQIRDNLNLTPRDRLDKLHGLYLNQLKNFAKINFVRSFMMINKNNQPNYFLFFGTNHLLGLEKMKDAMWKVDKKGAFEFSDVTHDPKQAVLFEHTPKFFQLKKEILEKFKHQKVSMKEIEDFVLKDTAFKKSHIRSGVLSKMEKDGEILVHSTGKRAKNTFPLGKTIIEFL